MSQKTLRVREVAQGKKKDIFLLLKEKKGRIGECCFVHPKPTLNPPRCAFAIPRELYKKCEEKIFVPKWLKDSIMVWSPVIPLRLRKSGDNAMSQKEKYESGFWKDS